MRVLRYWSEVIVRAVVNASKLVGVDHPKLAAVGSIVWLLGTILAFRFLGDPEEVMSNVLIGLCALAALGAVFVILVAVQLVTIPPTMAARDKEIIAQLQGVIEAPRPAVGPLRLKLNRFADVADERADDVPIDNAEYYYKTLAEVKAFIESRLSAAWVESINDTFSSEYRENIDPSWHLRRLSEWLRGCAVEIGEADVKTG